jgi:hypothetical protein
MDNLIGCVVIPAYNEFLESMVKRCKEFTTLIWPGHKAKANRMVSSCDWFTAGPCQSGQKERQPPQKAVPFLYRGIGGKVEQQPPYEISHVGLSVYMVHDDIYTNTSAIEQVLKELRVEQGIVSGWGERCTNLVCCDRDISTCYSVQSTETCQS